MDSVTVTVSGQIFKVSKALLKKHSGYFDQRFSDGNAENALELPGIPAEAFAVLVNYFTKSELNILDKSLHQLTALQDTACFLGVTTFSQDLEKALKTFWSKMVDLNTVFNVASRLGVHSAMVRIVVEDVIKLLLGEKEAGGLREAEFTYEIMIFVTRLKLFWESLLTRCKYSYTYESFYEAVICWIVRNNTSELNVDSLVESLRIETVSMKLLNDTVANAKGIPEMKEQIKFSLQKRQIEIKKSIDAQQFSVSLSCYDHKQGNVLMYNYNKNMFAWDEVVSFTRLPLETKFCALSESNVFALGDQTLTSIRIQGGSPVNVKYPERLEIHHCYAHGTSLFCFGWNKRDFVMYEYQVDRRKFMKHGTVPVDSNIVATCFDNDLYVLGEVLHAGSNSNELKVFKYNVLEGVFSWVAILKKMWSQPELTNDLEVKETGSNFKPHLVKVGTTMYALIQDFPSTLRSDIYRFQFKLDVPNTDKVEPRQLDFPTHLDNHSVLVNTLQNEQGILMLFRSPYKGDLTLAILNYWKTEVSVLGFLPHFANVSNISLEYVCLRRKKNPDSLSEVTLRNKVQDGDLKITNAASEITLVDENNLATNNILNDHSKSQDTTDYQSHTDGLENNQDPFVRSPSRSSFSSHFSSVSRASRKSKKGSKKGGFARRAVSVVASLVG